MNNNVKKDQKLSKEEYGVREIEYGKGRIRTHYSHRTKDKLPEEYDFEFINHALADLKNDIINLFSKVDIFEIRKEHMYEETDLNISKLSTYFNISTNELKQYEIALSETNTFVPYFIKWLSGVEKNIDFSNENNELLKESLKRSFQSILVDEEFKTKKDLVDIILSYNNITGFSVDFGSYQITYTVENQPKLVVDNPIYDLVRDDIESIFFDDFSLESYSIKCVERKLYFYFDKVIGLKNERRDSKVSKRLEKALLVGNSTDAENSTAVDYYDLFVKKLLDILFKDYSLISFQLEAFKKFETEDLTAFFKNISPIKNNRGANMTGSTKVTFALTITDHYFKPPTLTEEEAKLLKRDYSQQLFINVKLYSSYNGQIRDENDIFLGDIPKMTSKGTFIVNGSEKIIVTQIIRAPGVYYYIEYNSGKVNFPFIPTGQIMPTRGAYFQITVNQADRSTNSPDETNYGSNKKCLWQIEMDRKYKYNFCTFMMAIIGSDKPGDVAPYFDREDLNIEKKNQRGSKAMDATIQGRGYANSLSGALKDIYDQVKKDQASGATPDVRTCIIEGRKVIVDKYFNKRKYDLDSVGRKNLNTKLDVFYRLLVLVRAKYLNEQISKLNITLHTPDKNIVFIDDRNGNEVVFKHGVNIDENFISYFFDENDNPINRAVFEERLGKKSYQIKEGTNEKVMQYETVDGKPIDVEIVSITVGSYMMKIVGNNSKETGRTLTTSDIIATANHFTFIEHMKAITKTDEIKAFSDDIDNLSNRRVKRINELLLESYRKGFQKVEKEISNELSTYTGSDDDLIDIPKLFKIQSLISEIKEFFGQAQLAQPLDQVNPLSELTNKRRISALGAGGLKRDSAKAVVRNVHESQYGRVCPIETPEGQNIGLITTLASLSSIDDLGLIKTPYFKVKNCELDKPDKRFTWEFLSAHEEAQSHTWLPKHNHIFASSLDSDIVGINSKNLSYEDSDVWVREVGRNEIHAFEKIKNIDYIDASPKQIVSVSATCIPFLEHNDPTRILMATNMQRQAIPLIEVEAPFVATGTEKVVAKDTGVSILHDGKNNIETKKFAENYVPELLYDGVVTYVDSSKIVIEDTVTKLIYTYELIKFKKSNQSTCVIQRPIVNIGEIVKPYTIIADGPAVDKGEMALGRNVLVAYMTWEGYNYEDAVIMSSRLIKDDVYTSIHIERHECKVKRLKQGIIEKLTNKLENLNIPKRHYESHLDSDGIVICGTEVEEGDILVGKITPKGSTDENSLDPYDRILNSIYGDNAADYKSTSLKVPHGQGGVVCLIKRYIRGDGSIEFGPDEEEIIHVYIAQKRKINEGDKMAGRYGNKNVISLILPEEDMPYLEDGRPIDILLSPQGVPSRMNIGQVFEVALGFAALAIGEKEYENDKTVSNTDKKLHKESKKTTYHGKYFATPIFEGINNNDLQNILNDASETFTNKSIFRNYNKDETYKVGQMWLRDGRTGERFVKPVTVGIMYMLKLSHMVDDKLHARSDEGPYALVTSQPMGGKAKNGGQRFGEMEVWALEAFGAAYTLREMMTLKSDDRIGRDKLNHAIVNGAKLPEPGIPEAFKVMVRELQALGLEVNLVKEEVKIENELFTNESATEKVTVSSGKEGINEKKQKI